MITLTKQEALQLEKTLEHAIKMEESRIEFLGVNDNVPFKTSLRRELLLAADLMYRKLGPPETREDIK